VLDHHADAALARISGDRIARSDDGAATLRPAIPSSTLFGTWWSLSVRDVGSRGRPEAHLERGRRLRTRLPLDGWLSPVPALTLHCGGGSPSPQRLADVARGSPRAL